MRFVGTLAAWFFGAFVTYLSVALAAGASGLDPVAAMGVLVRAVRPTDALPIWIALAFGPAFYFGAVLKAVVPPIARVIYPLAGAAGMVGLHVVASSVDPFADPVYLTGWIIALVSGALGGLIFELFRPRR